MTMVSNHPWRDFLEARKRVVVYLHYQYGDAWNTIAEILSCDPGQEE